MYGAAYEGDQRDPGMYGTAKAKLQFLFRVRVKVCTWHVRLSGSAGIPHWAVNIAILVIAFWDL